MFHVKHRYVAHIRSIPIGNVNVSCETSIHESQMTCFASHKFNVSRETLKYRSDKAHSNRQRKCLTCNKQHESQMEYCGLLISPMFHVKQASMSPGWSFLLHISQCFTWNIEYEFQMKNLYLIYGKFHVKHWVKSHVK